MRLLLLATSWLLGAAWSGAGCRIDDPDHCAHRQDAEGRTQHAWCMAEHALPYCDRCVPSSERGGCTDVRPSGQECLPGEPLAAGSSSGEASSDTGPAVCEPNGPSEACAMADALAPFCRDGECVPCTDELCAEGVCDPRPGRGCAECRPDAASGCPGITPQCSDALECTDACTRHDQCPDSACDLYERRCIPPAGAVARVDGNLEPAEVPQDDAQCRSTPGASWGEIVTYCDLETALADAPNTAVIRVRALAEDFYRGSWTVPPPDVVGIDRVLVLMAEPGGGPVSLRSSSTVDDHLLQLPEKTRVALQGLELVGSTLSSTIGVDCQGDMALNTRLWLDDVELRVFEAGIVARYCDVWVRRTKVRDNRGIGIDVLDRSLRVESSVVAHNDGVGVRAAGSAAVELSFSSLLDNSRSGGTTNLECAVGEASTVDVDASIVLHSQAISSVGNGCTSDRLTIARSVTETDLAAAGVGFEELFESVVTGELSARGREVIDALDRDPALVEWALGDPYFDVEDEPRPRPDRPRVAPGANEP